MIFERGLAVAGLPMFDDLRHDWRDWSQAERTTALVVAAGLTLVLVTWLFVEAAS
jgi:hypothetical protein